MTNSEHLQWALVVPLGGHIDTGIVAGDDGTARLHVQCWGPDPVQPAKSYTLQVMTGGELYLVDQETQAGIAPLYPRPLVHLEASAELANRTKAQAGQ